MAAETITLADLELVQIPQLEFLDENKNLVIVPPFQITKYLITNALYYQVTGTGSLNRDNNYPRTNVTYLQAMNFVDAVNEQLNLECEIPTANQYEVLIRDGKLHPVTYEDYLARKRPIEETKMQGSSRLDSWPVGELGPNVFGIHDLTWPCWQWSQTPYPDNFQAQIIKGLSWYNFNGKYKTQDSYSRRLSSSIVGFRLALKTNPVAEAETTLSFLKS
jgi:formylglycine-generating enzyme required for sulfatase activity